MLYNTVDSECAMQKAASLLGKAIGAATNPDHPTAGAAGGAIGGLIGDFAGMMSGPYMAGKYKFLNELYKDHTMKYLLGSILLGGASGGFLGGKVNAGLSDLFTKD